MRTFAEGDQIAHVPRRGSRKPPGVKVDVVADGGKRWIRVNTYVQYLFGAYMRSRRGLERRTLAY